MNKRLPLLITTILAALSLAAPAQAGVQDFTIPNFEADYYLTRGTDGSSQLRVSEVIVARFPQTDQNHGILRAIPASYAGHTVNLQIVSVTDDTGRAQPYTTSKSSGNLVLRIGDANRYVHDLQTYKINYTMQNVTTTQSGFDGFFIDVNGDQWQQQFGQTTGRVHLPADLAGSGVNSTQCFTGPPGSTAQACTVTSTEAPGGESVITYTATRPLEAGETLTAEVRFNPGTFTKYTMSPAEIARLVAIVVGLFILPIFGTLAFVIMRWRKYGRDPKGRGVIVPEYLPPKDLSVPAADTLLRESFQASSISAQIVDLAVRHYLKIYETSQSKLFTDATYDVELVREPKNLRPEEHGVITLLFGKHPQPGTKVSLKSLENKLYKEATAIGKAVTTDLVTAGYFRTDPGAAKLPFLIAGALVTVLGFFAIPYSIGIIIAGVILLIASHFMPARTEKGVASRDYLLGLKHYMTIAESERIKVLQSPHGRLTEKVDVTDTTQLVKLYERLLPYAMIFGIEKAWAKEFADLYQQPPDWYSGSANFNAAYFAGSLSSFASASTSSFTPPSSSGGGGSAGGGGGGGGGGGW